MNMSLTVYDGLGRRQRILGWKIIQIHDTSYVQLETAGKKRG